MMKTRNRRFAVLLALVLLFALLLPCTIAPASASDQSAQSSAEQEKLPYSTEYWRYSDSTGQVSREDKVRLDKRATDAVKKYHFDFVVGVVRPYAEENESAEDYARRLYLDAGYGYGEQQQGILAVVVTDEDARPADYVVLTVGPDGERYFSAQRLSELKAAFQADVEAQDTLGEGYTQAATSFFTAAIRDVKTAQAADPVQTDETASESAEGSEQAAMPDWYPESWADFEYFYDPDAPQLTDTADIFTDEEEDTMREQLKALRETYGTDFVVFTDVSTYGLSRKVYAADFFEATGHGLGDDFSGMILFICMEEGNRGWWTAAKGSVKPLFTERSINWLDDRLEPHMKGGDYGAGVIQYLNDLDTLYEKGAPPMSGAALLFLIGGTLIAGLAGGGVLLCFVMGMMQTVKEAAHADSYLVKGSFQLRHSRDVFLYRSVSKTRRKSESSSGGGGSDYSSSYSSSSGSDWSGGGRSF